MTPEEAIELINCALSNGCDHICNYKLRGQWIYKFDKSVKEEEDGNQRRSTV